MGRTTVWIWFDHHDVARGIFGSREDALEDIQTYGEDFAALECFISVPRPGDTPRKLADPPEPSHE